MCKRIKIVRRWRDKLWFCHLCFLEDGTLDPANFPLGLKDTLTGGDLPVAWSNTKYRMVYFNMGHGDKILTDPGQNRLFEEALLWVARRR